jgi:hypothetical protein
MIGIALFPAADSFHETVERINTMAKGKLRWKKAFRLTYFTTPPPGRGGETPILPVLSTPVTTVC